MPVTSRTRSDSAIFLLEARIERQYDTKNCRNAATEITQISAAIIAPSPSIAPAPSGRPLGRVQTCRPRRVAATVPREAETSAERLLPILEIDCAARKCKHRH